jgi:hypothetical protein
MEFLRTRLRRGKLGEAAYLAINAVLPLAVLLLVNSFDSFYPALALVFLSKWRLLALRPRFWWLSLKANAVDLLVGASAVGLLWQLHVVAASVWLQLIVAILYAAWLLYLKPRSSHSAILLQAGIAQFVALTLLFSISAIVNDFVVVAGCWVIGYSAARHVLSNYEEESMELLSCLWGLLLVQLGWLLFHWTNTYDIGLPIKIPQIALLSLVISFAAARLYTAARANRLDSTVVRVTAIFSAVLVVVLLVFTRWDVTI